MRKQEYERIATIIVDACFNVHQTLGSGLLESAYQACLAYELKKRRVSIQTEVPLPIIYEEVKLDCGYRMDIYSKRDKKVIMKSNKILLSISWIPTFFNRQKSRQKDSAN